MSTIKTLAKGTVWILISLIIVKFFAFIYYIILARTVPEDEIGKFFFVLSVVSIISLFSDLGLGAGAVTRFVPFYAENKKFNCVKKVLKISISAATIFSILCAIFLIIFAESLSNLLNKPYLVPLFQIMASYFLITQFYFIASGFLQGRKLMKFVSYMQSIQQIFKTILTGIFLFFFGFTAYNIAFGFILSFLFAAFFGWFWVLKEYKSLPKTNDYVKFTSLLKEMVHLGLSLALISSIGMINSYTDRVMLGIFFPGKESEIMIAIYTIAIAFSSAAMGIFVGAIMTIFYPVITEIWARNDKDEMQRTTTTVIRWILISSIPILIIVLVFPTQILTIIYGEDYAKGYIALIIASFAFFIGYLSSPFSYILAAMNRLDVIKRIAAVGAGINFLLNFIFIPLYNINGAAFTTLISSAVVAYLFLTTKVINFKFPKDIYKPIISGILAAIILYLIAAFFNFDEILINFFLQNANISPEISKILKFFVLCVFALITFFIYLIFLIKFKAFHKEDVEILTGGMKRAKIPDKYIKFIEKFLLK